jgi:hypothetical protein
MFELSKIVGSSILNLPYFHLSLESESDYTKVKPGLVYKYNNNMPCILTGRIIPEAPMRRKISIAVCLVQLKVFVKKQFHYCFISCLEDFNK